MSSEKFCLRWNDFESNISCAFRELREDKDFFDVTLACDEDQVQVHKVILSACSNFFKSLLRRNPHNHPLLYLKGVKYSDLLCVLNFMYHGEVNIAQEDLNSFLAVAEDLQVKGLTQGPSNNGSRESQARSDQKPPSQPRPPPPPQSVPVKKARPVPPPAQPVDDDIQELAAPMVKVEPVHSQEQGAADQHQQQGRYHDGALQQLDEQGEYDESGYEDYSGYDGGSWYGGNMMEATATDKGPANASELFDKYLEKSMLKDGYSTFKCTICGKQGPFRANMRNHIESKHFPGNFSYNCNHCEKTFKTKNALLSHVSRRHRD